MLNSWMKMGTAPEGYNKVGNGAAKRTSNRNRFIANGAAEKRILGWTVAKPKLMHSSAHL